MGFFCQQLAKDLYDAFRNTLAYLAGYRENLRIFEQVLKEHRRLFKMSSETRKAERVRQTVFFIKAWEAEPGLWDVRSRAYKDRNIKQRSLRNLAEKCQMTGS